MHDLMVYPAYFGCFLIAVGCMGWKTEDFWPELLTGFGAFLTVISLFIMERT
jgi:hypothetical protein